jgi:hypothetical protein
LKKRRFKNQMIKRDKNKKKKMKLNLKRTIITN